MVEFLLYLVLYIFFNEFSCFFDLKKQENNYVKLEKYDFYRKTEIIIRRIFVIIWLVYPILAFIFCNWNEAHWITGCAIPFINKGFAEAVMWGSIFFCFYSLITYNFLYILCFMKFKIFGIYYSKNIKNFLQGSWKSRRYKNIYCF